MTPPGRPSANDVRTRLRINAPSPFSFWETVRSHGWCLLPPFFIDQPSRTLTRVFTVDGDKPVICHIAADGKSAGLNAYSRRALTAAQRERLMRDIRSCLRLDEDFSAFYAAARRSPRYRWIASRGAGRLLRSPTVFEDAVKMICTTNCT
jgi:3-methyladenine DNA glycosylase/8-oxoguanine DNA glycosylase